MKEDITIKVIRKNMYIDYETYEVQVINHSNNTIMLDDFQGTKNIYIQDVNKVKYSWFNHEYIENDVTVLKGFTKNISIKFNRAYNPTSNITNMFFSKIQLDNKQNIEINIIF